MVVVDEGLLEIVEETELELGEEIVENMVELADDVVLEEVT